MKKKSIKLLTALGAVSMIGGGLAVAQDMRAEKHDVYVGQCNQSPCRTDNTGYHCYTGVFARGSETKHLTIGGFIEMGFQNIWATDKGDGTVLEEANTAHYNNFLMRHVRLSVEADIGGGWCAYINADFGKQANINGGKDKYTNEELARIARNSAGSNGADGGESNDCDCCAPGVTMHKVYIQKKFGDHKARLAYQKVSWGFEEMMEDEMLKPIARGTTSNFFTNLGNHGFGGRHTGAYLSGEFSFMDSLFFYSAELVNGYQGECPLSQAFESKKLEGFVTAPILDNPTGPHYSNNDLGFYASVGHAFMVESVDFVAGINIGYQGEGHSTAASGGRRPIWGLNPYFMATYDQITLVGEFFWTNVDSGALTNLDDAHPWGFTVMPSIMFDNNWELIGRFGYVDTDCHGTTMINAFGCLPDCPWVSNGNQKNFTGSKLYDKVYSWYLGANYYLMNRAIKASVGYEGARFKDSYFGGTGGLNNSFCGQSASASAIRASVQLVF